jgi:hypothetical protein
MASTVHPSQSIHRHDIPRHRVGNDYLAGPGVDWEVTQHMIIRHWRIQVSLICFTLFLAVIVLWVRSYSWKDRIEYHKNSTRLAVVSVLGDVYFGAHIFPPDGPTSEGSWGSFTSQVTKQMTDNIDTELTNHSLGLLGFRYYDTGAITYIVMPYWFISIFFALLCGLPWYWRRFNFSLRTFFIAFTVLAMVLGFIGWLIR